ncbi:hypothetical protein OBBRIDRAFT_802282 [Obba rivulosa]|uniref:DNA polymerase II subunit 2 n=1 Tax=Obba rivulosa TaxID=1052685 RepID=A0A8E2DN05_9APHY|nr:hypothetical protein OBBRIDRAFT_802282 [Obba rivulosa]
MADARQRAIIKVFRKYSHSLGPEALEFLENLLNVHEVADESVEHSIEWIAKEYNRQDDILQRVYETFQGSGDSHGSAGQDILDPESHLFFIDAYDMPLWHWSNERSTFERANGPLTLSGSADSRILAMRNRLDIIRQTVLRNEHFSPSTIPSRDRDHLLTLRSTKQLLGRPGERFLLLGMLTYSKEGKLCLEDQDGSVELDFSQLVGPINMYASFVFTTTDKDQPSEGLFTEGCTAMIEGDYTDDATLVVIAIGHPPCESRETARQAQLAARVRLELPDLNFFVLSDVWLDSPETLTGLSLMFNHCIDNNFIPKVIILCGNFSRRGISQGNSREEIVIFREDLMAKMLRNLVGVKPDVRSDDLKRFSHLTPLTNSIQATLADFDHTLRLYPLPTACHVSLTGVRKLVLADKYDRYELTYEGCHVFNPGSFVGKSFAFSAYIPARRESEECCPVCDPCFRVDDTMSFAATLISIVQLLLYGSQQGSSAWTVLVLWAIRIVTLSLLFRTYIGPSILNHVSDRLRVQSVSPRSIRGIYFRSKAGTWRIERVGISYHRPAIGVAGRFSFMVEGLLLELAKTSGQDERSPPPRRHSGRPRLADFAPSPLARNLWSIIRFIASTAYSFLDPYVRPIIRALFVGALRTIIRALPALTHVVDFELMSATITASSVPGLRIGISEAKIQTEVVLQTVENVPAVEQPVKRRQRMHKRFQSVADWNARLSGSLQRTWDRAWGETRVMTTLTLLINNVSGIAPLSLRDDSSHAGSPRIDFLGMPRLELSLSVGINPHSGIEARSLKTSLSLNTIRADVDVLDHVLKHLKPGPKHDHNVNEASSSFHETPALSSRMSWVSPLSPASPLLETLSATMPFSWGPKTTRVRRLSTSTRTRVLQFLNSLRAEISELTLCSTSSPGVFKEAQKFEASVKGVVLVAGLSHPNEQSLHREWLGSRHEPHDKMWTDAYQLGLCIHHIKLDRTGLGTIVDHLQIVSIGPVDLQALTSQWPLPWVPESAFLAGDPNAHLAVVKMTLGSIQITERSEVLQALLDHKRARERKDTGPLIPDVLAHIPRFSLMLHVGEICGLLISNNRSNERPLAFEMRSTGLGVTVHNEFRSIPDKHSPHASRDYPSAQMDLDALFTLDPTFVSVFGSDTDSSSPSRLPGQYRQSAEPLISVDSINISTRGSGVGELLEDPYTTVSLDAASLYLDVRCWTEVISVELWHPGVIEALASVVAEFSATQKAPVEPKAAGLVNRLPIGISASLSVGQLAAFVTAPDLAPGDDLNISRGISLRTALSISYTSLGPRHAETLRELLPWEQRRLQLSLPSDPIIKALASLSAPVTLSYRRVFSQLTLRNVGVRDAVSTPFSADVLFDDNDGIDEKTSSKFLEIPRVAVEVTLSSSLSKEHNLRFEDECSVGISVPSIKTSLYLSRIYSLLLATQTMKAVFSTSSQPKPTRLQPSATLFRCHCSFDTIQILCEFPVRSKLFMRMNALRIDLASGQSTKVKWASTVLATILQSDGIKHVDEHWEELGRLSDWHLDIQTHNRPISVSIEGDCGLLRIPFDFVLADLILDVNVAIKAIRHLVRMVPSGRFDIPHSPEAESAKIVSPISIRLQCLTCEAADEDIEAKLALIWRAGHEAARIREEREDAFHAKVSTLDNRDSTHAPAATRVANDDYQFSPKYTVSIADAQQRLFQIHSVSWRSSFTQAVNLQRRREESHMRWAFGTTPSSKGVEDLVPVMPRNPIPPLCRLTLEHLSLMLTPPSVSDIALPDLLHILGDGVPRDMQYTLLIPLHIRFTVSSLRLSFREYPLPLLNIPSHSDGRSSSLEFDGDVVIAEEMGTAASVEWIDCEIVRAHSGIQGATPLSIPIPKTIMPVKTYANPIIRVTTDDVTDFAWGVSYGPATQDIMRVLDTLSHASRDLSPPIGFWDKLRLIFHWRVKVLFDHEVHLHIKGSRDPYELGGRGAGFALCWKGDPQLTIGHRNPESELIQVISNSMLVVIPNLEDAYGQDGRRIPPARRKGARRYQKVCAKVTSGVCFGVGFVLERTCGPECTKCTGNAFQRQCRFFKFRPHYTVKLEKKERVPEIKSPEDSYNSFRSDFIHMSISLTSAVLPSASGTSNAYSSIHLSPAVFANFWSWWSLFDSNLSLPIRQGSRYPRKRPVSPKFGQHLATLKYRITLAQLFICHVYTDNSQDAWADGVTPFVGVKTMVENFQADLHQRDQESTRTTHSRVKTIHHKPFYAIEVVIKGLDLRALLAVFSDPLKQTVSELTETPSSTSSYRKRSGLTPVDIGSPWVDLEDYTEGTWTNSSTPDVYVLPMTACPQFTYVKRAVDANANSPSLPVERTKFGSEDTHLCYLGKEASIPQVQIALTSLRIKELQGKISPNAEVHVHNGPANVNGNSIPKEPSERSNDVRRMILLLEDYIRHLRKVDAESNVLNASSGQSYYMPSDTVSPEEWAEFDNVYQILMQYYHCSRSRRGFEYHMATRAVKFIRDQALAALAEVPDEPELDGHKGPVANAQAAAMAVRKFLAGDQDSNAAIQHSDQDPALLDPLDGWTEGVSLRKSHICLLLKPQIVLRSETSAESVCVLTAVQGKLKSFAIMDDSNADDPVSGKVMSRNFASLSGLQTFSPSIDNKCGEGHLPLEVLIDLRCETSAFDRLVPQTEASFQYDKFNRLRLRNNVTSVVRPSEQQGQSHQHLQNQTDLVRLYVPRFTVSANDRHFQAISNIVTNLVLFSNAALKIRSERLEKMLFSYDFTNLGSAADVVASMQTRLRRALESQYEAERKLRDAGEAGRLELLKVEGQIRLLVEELNLVFDAIKLAQDKAHDNPQKNSALLFHASSSEISWRMLDQQDQLIAKLDVRDSDFYWLNRHDSSTVNDLSVGDLRAFDGAADAVWTEILSKYTEPSTHPLVKRKLFLLADWIVLPPVGGITIYERFELTLHPLRLQLDTRVGHKIMEYVWPSRKHRQPTENDNSGHALLDSNVMVEEPQTIADPPRRSFSEAPARKSEDSHRLKAPSLRKLGASRSFTDLRNMRNESLQVPRLHKTRSTESLVSPSSPSRSLIDSHKMRTSTSPGEIDDATEMKARSSQKTFVWVRVASLHLMLSIQKEGSFLCRDARIRTRDLEYRNQTLSFEQLVDQFIPSGRNWTAWVKMAFQQPLVPVLPVARELISKTKWIATGKNNRLHDAPRNRSGSPGFAMFRSSTSSDGQSVKSKRQVKEFPSKEAEQRQWPRSGLANEIDAASDSPSDYGSPVHQNPRPRMLSMFKRRHDTKKSVDSDASGGNGYANLYDNSAESSNRPRARRHSVADYLNSPPSEALQNGTTSPSRPRAYTTSASRPSGLPSRPRRPSRVSQHILNTNKGLPPLPSTVEERADPFNESGELYPVHRHSEQDRLSLLGRQTDLVVLEDPGVPGRIDRALSLSHIGTCEGSLEEGEHHHDDIVEHLDVIVVLPRRRQRQKDAGSAEKGQALEEDDEDLLDQHVEDVLRKRDRLRRVMQGVWSFLKTPLGVSLFFRNVITAIYGFLVVFWGTGIVFFLAKFIDLHNSITQGFWVELCQQVETGIVKIWRYKRRIAKLRRKAGLPELYDPDDLPDPVYDENYVHVLTEEEQMDLHYQQHKFMESQTWYRPHGTETHRAFPIKFSNGCSKLYSIALWICVMNDLNSFFQCLLSGTMWGLDRFARPAWTTATTLPAAFIAGIAAAVLIWWGGRKTKRTEEVERRLRMALAMERKPRRRSQTSVAGEGNSNIPPAQAEPLPTSTSPETLPQCQDFADCPNEPEASVVSITIADEMSVPPAHALGSHETQD